MARQWATKAETKFDMECSYCEGDTQDTLCFARPGVKGKLDVLADSLNFHAQLGFLVSAFKERIQSELEQQLDSMLASLAPPNDAANDADADAGAGADASGAAEPVDMPDAAARAVKKSSTVAAAQKAPRSDPVPANAPQSRTRASKPAPVVEGPRKTPRARTARKSPPQSGSA